MDIICLKRIRVTMSKIEEMLALHLRADKIEFQREWMPMWDGRKFRFDFALIDHKLAIECDGGIWMKKGAHNTGTAMQRDRDKDELALLNGWTVYRVTESMVKSGRAINTIKALINN
jgi:very-short-patch-repair endonuclease